MPTDPSAQSLRDETPPTIPQYEVLRLIGKGSYGRVSLARTITNVYQAIKVVSRDNFQKTATFNREFEALQKYQRISSHPGLLQILHVGKNEADGYFYYVMELADDRVPGQRLTHPDTYKPAVLTTEHSLPVAECINIGVSLVGALAVLHKHGLMHRDIKPSNTIFVNGQAQLADIGLVTDIRGAASYVGTNGYIAPEGPTSPQADIYSLGIVLYELSTGKDRLDFPALHTNVGSGPDHQQFLALNSIVRKACAEDRFERYPNAQEMHDALLRISPSAKRSAPIVISSDFSKRVCPLCHALMLEQPTPTTNCSNCQSELFYCKPQTDASNRTGYEGWLPRQVASYSVEKCLEGDGAMLTVEATQCESKQAVIIKIFQCATADDLSWKDQITKQIEKIKALNHQGLVRLLDSGQAEQIVWIAMELIQGETLDRRIAQAKADGKVIPLEDIREWILQTAATLGYLHTNGIVLGSLMPSDILVGGDNKIKLSEYVIAQMCAPTTQRTVERVEYVAPEVRQGQLASPASDIYSMAVIWYEVLTGCRPMGMAGAKGYREDCPNLWERIIKACLAPDPTARPQLSFLAPRVEALAVREYVPCPKCHTPVHIASWKCPFCRCRFRMFTDWLETNAGCVAFLGAIFLSLGIGYILVRYFNVNAYTACLPLYVVFPLLAVLSNESVKEWMAKYKTPLPETASAEVLFNLWGVLGIAVLSYFCGAGNQMIRWLGIFISAMIWIIVCSGEVTAFRKEHKKVTVDALKSFTWRHFKRDPSILWVHIFLLVAILLFATQAYAWAVCLMLVYYWYIEVTNWVEVWSQNRKVDPHATPILLICDRDIIRGITRTIIYSAITLIAMGLGRHFKS